MTALLSIVLLAGLVYVKLLTNRLEKRIYDLEFLRLHDIGELKVEIEMIKAIKQEDK